MVKPGGGENEDVFAFKHIENKFPMGYLGDMLSHIWLDGNGVQEWVWVANKHVSVMRM